MVGSEEEGAAAPPPPPPPPPPQQQQGVVAAPPPLAPPPPPLAAPPAPLQQFPQHPAAHPTVHQQGQAAQFAHYHGILGPYTHADHEVAEYPQGPELKRARFAPPAPPDEHGQGAAGPAFEAAEPREVPEPSPEEQVKMCAALRKIRTHIAQAAKQEKASLLLCKLLSDDALSIHYRDAVFQVLCEAFSFVAASSLAEPASARALLKVLDALEEKEGQLAFTAAQRRHMGVWRLTVIMPQQLSTDDSFMFNKSAKNVRELVEALPEVEDGENAALVHVTEEQWDRVRREEVVLMDTLDSGNPDTETLVQPKPEPSETAADGTASGTRGREEQVNGADKAGKSEAADDPFGVADLLKDDKSEKDDTPEQKVKASAMVWNRCEARAMRRHVLLACLEKLKERSALPWARTAAHLALQAAKTHRESFCEAHQERLQALVSFLQKAKANLSKGPSASQLKQDSNAFEIARREWGNKAVSHRGKVGAMGGDIQNANWLG